MQRDPVTHHQVANLNCRGCGRLLRGLGVKQVSLAVPEINLNNKRGKGHRLTAKSRSLSQRSFLALYSEKGSIGATLSAVGVDYGTFRRWKEDPVFLLEFEAANEAFKGRLHDETVRRAVEGVIEPVVSAGRLVTNKRVFSDTLLTQLNRAHAPEIYSDGRKGIGAELSKNEDGTVTMKVYQGFNPDDV